MRYKVGLSTTVDPAVLKRLDEYRESLMIPPSRAHIISLALERYLEGETEHSKTRLTSNKARGTVAYYEIRQSLESLKN